MRFSKLREFGNDFMVVDAVTQLAYFSPEMIRRLAHRKKGVGFTQLILIEPPYVPELDFYCRIFDADGNERKNDIEGGFAIAQFIRQTELSAKSLIKIGTANGSFVIHQKNLQQLQLEIEYPVFEPEQLPFRAMKAEQTYIIRQDEFTLFCGVAQLKSLYCLVFDWALLQHDLHRVEQVLQRHERFSVVPQVSFVALQNGQIKILFNHSTTELCPYIATAAVSAAHALRYDALRHSIKIVVEDELMMAHAGKNARTLLLEGRAQWLFDGILPR